MCIRDRTNPIEGDRLDYDEVVERYKTYLKWLCRLYVNTMNVIHFMHDKYAYEKIQMEKRMAEIAVLRTHIVNYAKTREVYVAYRKAGYSKKFREEHEEEILLHQAAKNAFDEMGVKKLPKVKAFFSYNCFSEAVFPQLLASSNHFPKRKAS